MKELKKSTYKFRTGLSVFQPRFELIHMLWHNCSVRGFGAYPLSSLVHFRRNKK